MQAKPAQYSKQDIQRKVDSVPFWFHSIPLPHGIVTPGWVPVVRNTLLDGVDLQGKTVLDIGSYDGALSFEAENRGARRVVALDSFVWEHDVAGIMKCRDECIRDGRNFDAVATARYYDPENLPGKRPFDIAHEILSSRVEVVVADFMAMDLDTLGQFDVVIYAGVLYHMRHPLLALERVASVTKGMAIIESEAVAIPGHEGKALCEFFEGSEHNNDPSNWWAFSESTLMGMCRAAGFDKAALVIGEPKYTGSAIRRSVGSTLRRFGLRAPLGDGYYRALVHASKS
jgi:tRNA (mo5U34)-methyltransferase